MENCIWLLVKRLQRFFSSFLSLLHFIFPRGVFLSVFVVQLRTETQHFGNSNSPFFFCREDSYSLEKVRVKSQTSSSQLFRKIPLFLLDALEEMKES